MLRCAVIVLFYVSTVWGLEEGDPCSAMGEPGVCRLLEDCEYAVKLIQIDQKKPVVCRWDYTRNVKIVCCPIAKRVHTIGAFRSFFSSSKNGVIHSTDMSCWYGGTLPIACCQNVAEAPPPAEPATCPALDLPEGDTSDIAFQKCLEYQRYVSLCVSSDSNPDTYVREDTCGIVKFGDRITGGTPAERNEFPHMALLGCRNEVNTGLGQVAWVAGGSLISDRYILTAGHVLSHRDYGQLKYALLGATNKSEAKNGLLYNIIDMVPHKLWVKNEKSNDIALLLLDRRVDFSEFIRPACLPSPQIQFENERILAGWGRTGEQASESQILLKASVPEFDYDTECKHQFSKDFHFDKKTMLCAAGGKDNTRDSCQGDSGGPLMAVSSNVPCTYVVRGIVSFGQRCGAGVPGLYTNVEAYMPWIQSVVWRKPSA